MTATEDLWTLSDEHGLESGYPHTLRPELHRALDASGIHYWVAQGLTFWNCTDGRECVAYGFQANGKPKLAMKIVGITDPAQVIEATLGRGTCKQVIVDCYDGLLPPFTAHCSVCGEEWGFTPNFCPNCGRKVEQC